MIFSSVVYLSLDMVLDIHEDQLAVFGGQPGLRDRGSLEAAVEQPKSGFGETEFYPGPFKKAAAYAFHIAEAQAFVDGNKRTAVAAALLFLALNGHEVPDQSMALYEAMISVANKEMDKDGLADVFKKLVLDFESVAPRT